MAGQNNQDILQRTVDAFAQRVDEYAQGIASRLGGGPLSGVELSKDDAIARWNFSPLGSTAAADQQYHQLVSQGTPPGQALDQVYPMRSQLFRGQDLNEAIGNAKQIAGWVADATGKAAPETPQTSTLPLLMAAQRTAQSAPTGALPAQAPPQPALNAPAPLPTAPPPAATPIAPPPPPMPVAPNAPLPTPTPQQLGLPLPGVG